MKLQVVSDIHLEFGDCILPVPERDVLILAGDISVGMHAIFFIKEQLKHSPVIYVPGNHEYYGQDIEEVRAAWKDVDLPNFYFLDNKSCFLGGILFAGGTLWTDYDRGNWHAKNFAKRGMYDHEVIRRGNRKFLPDDAEIEHQHTYAFLDKVLLDNAAPKVVVTHHLPSFKSIDKNYAHSPLNPAFASDLDALIVAHQPDLWIHGHTHSSHDYKIGETRIVCNPRGYVPDAVNHEWNPGLVVEVNI